MPLRSTLVLGTFSLCTSPRSVVAAFSNRTLTLSLSEICCKITTFYSNTQTQIARIHTIFAEIVEKHHFSAFIFAYFDKKLYLCTQIVSFMKKLLNVYITCMNTGNCFLSLEKKHMTGFGQKAEWIGILSSG